MTGGKLIVDPVASWGGLHNVPHELSSVAFVDPRLLAHDRDVLRVRRVICLLNHELSLPSG